MENQPVNEIDWVVGRKLIIFNICLIAAIYLFFDMISFLRIPVILSIFLAYMLLPIVNKISKFKINKFVSSFTIISIVIFLMTVCGIKFFPFVYKQVMQIAQNIPEAAQQINEQWVPIVEKILIENHIMDKNSFKLAIENLNLASQFAIQLENAVKTIFNSVPKVLGSIVNIVFIPLLTFFLLVESPHISDYIKKLIPFDLRPGMKVIMKTTDETLRAVIRGQFTVAGILSVLYVVGLSIVGMEFAIVIGLVAGLCRVIPYLDLIVGLFLSGVVLVSTSADFGLIAAVLGVFLVVQSIDGVFITPKIIGVRMGLHPMVVVFSVVTFGNIMGFWGGLIAIPAIGLFKNIWNLAMPYYFQSPIYKDWKENMIKNEGKQND